MKSVVVPVYRNAESISRLVAALEELNLSLAGELEAVFVVDGCTDDSYARLRDALAKRSFTFQLILLSKNFGSFAAIRVGLEHARGEYFAVMAADLQEPPSLMLEFFGILSSDHADIVIGTRRSRGDPWFNRMLSSIFWFLYRKLVMPDIPSGGVDVFGCNQVFRAHLLALKEHRSSLIGQIFWLGFRRKIVSYDRQPRLEGKSAWGFRRKLDYLFDSLYAFSDLPIRILTFVGGTSLLSALLLAITATIGRLTGQIEVPGYAPLLLTVLAFGGFNALGLGIVGTYAWRAYENTKERPLAIVMNSSRSEEDNQ